MMLRLGALFVITPIVEIYLFMEIGALIGIWQTIGIVFLTGLAGAALVKAQALSVWQSLNLSFYEARMPTDELVEMAVIIAGGALLLTPGFLTDFVGLVALLPGGRRRIRDIIKRYFKRRIAYDSVVIDI